MIDEKFFKDILDGAKADFNGLRKMGVEITSEKIEKYASMRCDFETCRYNEDGICQNEDERKECVEVSRMVLCLEGEDEINKEAG